MAELAIQLVLLNCLSIDQLEVRFFVLFLMRSRSFLTMVNIVNWGFFYTTASSV
jgi:hypothetical protein